MSLTNQPKPTTSFSNLIKVSIGETWGTITTTWASETRTWLGVSQLITDIAKPSILSLSLWASTSFPWLMTFPWIDSGGAGMTNVDKPL